MRIHRNKNKTRTKSRQPWSI